MNNDGFNFLKKVIKKSVELLEETSANNLNNTMNATNKENIQSNNITIVNVEANDEYTNLNIFGGKARFKLAKNSFFNMNTNTGAAEIDATLNPINSNDSIKTHIGFNNDGETNEEIIKNNYKNWYNINNIMFEDINKGPFTRYFKVDNQNHYCESYYMYYDANLDGQVRKTYYNIYLILYKNEFSTEDINKIVSEFHLVIDTLELL